MSKHSARKVIIGIRRQIRALQRRLGRSDRWYRAQCKAMLVRP
jgi:hypothetical protein